MTKPRLLPDRELFGILGSIPDRSALQSNWNKYFMNNKIDAFLDNYPTTKENIHERLSEMFHFDRRGYIVGGSLQKEVIPFLDSIDDSVKEEGANIISNKNGVLTGRFVKDISPQILYEYFLTLQ
ncbi:hypothetical protein HN512_03990 [Candidatus Peregrinibacteria bacterium]|jgi:shikimate 5-dehydrogenase|nr:hypothetical protein [Candidatus Peregrinibacteria bacterium]MBT3598970.1 hypothetical protein [Candidatus Peregrinibacteria bacterium]MBT4367529.1 hypothetical protein [Candidatus Peregrinibacteria bacterium]MBT4585504.1 hypothetical protein [Candidatus Peregrinibacteria bacterium]MBT6731319.1 hypothetical protein [Candidatus Peregrinibacteria bacterium]